MRARSGLRISAAVMTHPTRVEHAERIAAELDRIGCVVVTDPDPASSPSALRTARAAWAAAGTRATHHLLLQDDVELSPCFLDGIRRAVAARPDAALAFFTEWGSRSADMLRIAALSGSSWVECVDGYLPSTAVVLPRELATGFATEVGQLDTRIPDDNALLRYLRACRASAYISVPNLVEHTVGPSLVGNDWMGVRRAACFLPDSDTPFPGHGTVWPAARVVPHLAWENVAAVCYLADAASPTGWRVRPLGPYLDACGLPESARRDVREEALAVLPGALRDTATEAPVARRWLVALADVAAALGFAGASRLPALSRPGPLPAVGAAALRTMAFGGLRLHVGLDVLTAHADELAEVVTTAVRSAARMAAQGRVPPLDCWSVSS